MKPIVKGGGGPVGGGGGVQPPPVVGGGGVGGGTTGSGGGIPKPGPTPAPNPNPAPAPAPAPSPGGSPTSGTVKATDGSTISWAKGTNGTLTATSSKGPQFIERVLPQGTAKNVVRSQGTYSAAAGQAPFLTVTHTIDLNRRQVYFTWQASQVTLTLCLNLPTDGSKPASVPATLSGTSSGKPVKWQGTVSATALSDPRKLPGWPAGVLDSQLTQATYFAPLATVVGSSDGAKADTGSAPSWWETALEGIEAALDGLENPELGLFRLDYMIIDYDVQLLLYGLPDAWTVTPWTFTPDPAPPPTNDLFPPDPDNPNPDGGVPDGGIDDGGDGGGGGCFVQGTPVTTWGRTVPIDQVRVEDRVCAMDVDGAGIVDRAVTRVFELQRDEIVVLDFGEEEIRCTPPHRFFTGDWVPAGKLAVGDAVLGRDGRWHTIVGISRERGSRSVYNLSVAQTHTYMVGRAGLVVHNVKVIGGDGQGDGTGDGGDTGEGDDE